MSGRLRRMVREVFGNTSGCALRTMSLNSTPSTPPTPPTHHHHHHAPPPTLSDTPLDTPPDTPPDTPLDYPWTHSPDTQNPLDPCPTLPEHSPHSPLTIHRQFPHSPLTVSSQPPHSSRTDTPTSQTFRTLPTLRAFWTRQTLDMVQWRPSTEEEKVVPCG